MFAPKMFLEAPSAEDRFAWPLAQWELSAVPGHEERDRLALRLVAPEAAVQQTWAPMREAPELYREAAALPTENPQALLDWVNQRGMLWWPVQEDPRTPVLTALVFLELLAPGRSAQTVVSPFELSPEGWPYVLVSKVQTALQALRQAVELLDALRGGRRSPRDWSSLPIPAELFRDGETQARKLGVPRDYLLAWAALEEAVSSRLRLTATFSRLPFGSRHLLSKRALLRAPGLRVDFVPITLESCLWWQFFQDAFGGRPARVCPGCGEIFFPRRIDQKWHRKCYSRHYMRNYRR